MQQGHRLSELAEVIGGDLRAGGADRAITSLVIDSRKPVNGDGTLFIALKGPRHDGHRYIAELTSRGVRNFMVQRGVPASLPEGVNAIEVDDGLAALQRIAGWHRSLFHYPVIGITGSNGKTVVKEWLFQLLRDEEHIVRSPGSWNSQVGVPLSVWEMRSEHTLGIFEAGISQPGEMERLAPIIAPTMGIFTNIGPAHGEHFPEGDAQKAREKAILFAHAGVVIYCRDHHLVRDALSATNPGNRRLVDWSRHDPAFLRVVHEKREAARTEVLVEVAEIRHPLSIPFADDASVENALHCITVLFHLGHSATWINERLAHLQPVAMRLRMAAGVHGSLLIDDSYSNDLASLGLALDHLARMGGDRRRIAVISDIAESDEDPGALHARMTALLKNAGIDQLYAIGPAMAAHRDLFGARAEFFNDADELLGRVPPDALADAAVLIKGARKFELERVVERWQERTHGTELRIDLDAVRHNLNHYRSMIGPGVKVMAMVKAFGYGSGAVELAQLFEHERVHYLGVAYADEGVELRQHGIRTPILVMNPEPVPLDVLHRFQLEPEIYDLATLRAAIVFARHTPEFPPVHIKLDTGMHRLGFTMEETPALIDALREVGPLRVGSVFSHLAASEDAQHDTFTREQINQLLEIAERIAAVLGYRPLCHIANSAGATRFPEARLGMVRLGIGLHGIGADEAESRKLYPVATLRTVIAQVKKIPAGESVSYGRAFVAKKDMRIAVLPIGYADGLSRRLGNGRGRVWVKGQAAVFTGTICMDMCMVDVTDIECSVGEEVIVFGPGHPVQEYARDLGTIPYEALTSISPRVRRVYTHG